MSGIKIKNMYLPKSCLSCPLALLDKYADHHCFVTGYNVTLSCEYDERHSECPMEEIEDN